MSFRQIYWESWALGDEADRLFRRTFGRTAVPLLILALIITLINLPEPVEKKVTYEPPRYAELLPPPPKPPEPTPQPVEENKPVEPTKTPPPKPVEKKPEPTPEQKQEVAKRVAEKEMKVFDQLAKLRDNKLLDNTPPGQTTANLITSTGAAGGPPPAFAQGATTGSGGIGKTAGLTGNALGGTGLGSHGTGAVKSSIGGLHVPGVGEGGKAGRTLDEIQRVFDANQGGFYAIFNRAARDNPSIGAGKIIVNLTIAPDGTVTNCQLVSSTFGDPELERKIIARVKLMNFGSKPVPPFTYPNYPINYIPPS